MESEQDRKIRERAYELWEQGGRREGQSHEHWSQAEAEHAGGSGDAGGIVSGETAPMSAGPAAGTSSAASAGKSSATAAPARSKSAKVEAAPKAVAKPPSKPKNG